MIKIGFTGDFCPWERIENEFAKGNTKDLFDSVSSFFNQNDFNIVDLECPLTTQKVGITKTGPNIKSNPATAELLKTLNVSLVATANNHFKDYGWEGMKETYDVLKKNNIEWFGSGSNLSEASSIKYQILGDIKFAFINFAENEWTTTQGNYPGCNPINPIKNYYAIQEAKKNSDFVIVIAHGGHENYNLPSPRIQNLFRFFIDSGASAVIAHHTHIISGFEIYKNAPIFYSLGNFCFDWKGVRNSHWNFGLLLRLIFEKDKTIKFEYEFVEQNNDEVGVRIVKDATRIKMYEEIKMLSQIIGDEEKLKNKFDIYAKSKTSIMKTWVQPYSGKITSSLFKRGWLPAIMKTKKLRLLTNLIRCESHRDILLYSLNEGN